MCGGITFRTSNYDFPGVLEHNTAAVFKRANAYPAPSNDIRPGMSIAVIKQTGGNRALDLSYWGYQPSPKAPMAINAKSENLTTSSYWKNAFNSRRCVIPCDGWYEWVAVDEPPKSAKDRLAAGLTRGGKQRYFIEFNESPIVYLAGLYGEGAHKQPGKAGQWQRSSSAVIITTPACANMAPTGHHRQPVVLNEQMIDQWLAHGTDNADDLLQSRNYDRLSIKPISGPLGL